jgi:NADPH:quinone reductase-like Zn-dependent oxidoreductase
MSAMQEQPPESGTVSTAQYQRFGPPDVLLIQEVAAPVPGPSDVVVRVAALSVNRIDTAARSGRQTFLTGRRFPQRTGLDFSGTVTSVGSQVAGIEPGQRVWGFLGTDRLGRRGTAATRIVVAADLLSLAPAAAELADAAALPLVGLTAWQAMEELKVEAGSRLLIVGGAGGVGSVAVQVARSRGAVVDTVSSARHDELLRRLGAVSRFEPGAVPWQTLRGRYQAVLDTTGAHLWRLRRAVAPGGRLVTISPAGLPISIVSKALPGHQVSFLSVRPSRAGLSVLADLVDAGQVTPIIRARFALGDIARAHALVETGHGEGKVVVDVG